MTAEIPVPEGPPCDFCTDWPAVGSLMNLADYTVQRFCANCGPAFLVGIVEAMTGVQIMVPVTDADRAATDAELAKMGADPLTDAELAELDSKGVTAPKPDPMTEHVVRSTHGHRGGAKPKAGDPE